MSLDSTKMRPLWAMMNDDDGDIWEDGDNLENH